MKVASSITATEYDLKYLGVPVTQIQEDLTLPNPEYANMKRFGKGRFYKTVSPHICYLKKIGDSYVIPRYYFGEVRRTSIDERIPGRNLTSSHHIKLRDYQEEFINANEDIIRTTTGLIIEAPCGHGKCHGKGTKILMYDGSVKNVEDIKVGELLMGDDSTPRRVLSLARGREELFLVKQVKGENYIVNRSHILSLQKREWGKSSKGEIKDICVEEYLALSKTQKSYLYGYCVPIEYEEKSVKIPPYILGAWLGDGSSKLTEFTCDYRDRKLVRAYRDYAFSMGLTMNRIEQKNNNSNIYRIKGVTRRPSGHIDNHSLNLFREYNLIGNKHIPEDYIVNSRENRLELLAGLIDTDGSYSNHTLEITQKRKSLSEDIRRLCWSLGFRVSMSPRTIKGKIYYRLTISGNIHEIPTRLNRKKITRRTINKDPHVNGIKLESIGEGDYYGFALDGNHRYCLWDGTVTHNTILGIWLAFLRGKQTMILVPTYYLAQQWKERIEEFTDASVVILRSTDKEVPLDSDFTIVVMDLLTCRQLPKELIKNIGHVILDEAHRVGAEVYLPILDEVPAMYRTALTATFRRNDGVHKILKYHFGEHIKMDNRFPKPAIYAVRTGVKVSGVLSKNKPHEHFKKFLDGLGHPYTETSGAIQLQVTDALRDEVEEQLKAKLITKTAYREIVSSLKRTSEMSYSVLDTYLSEHCGRRKLIIKLIQKCLDAGRTVLFISKRKDVLKSLHRYFEKYRPMLIVSETNDRSEEDNKFLQEECRLVFGVTQLTKEGLDIDRLDTLIFHLPMKDTEQAIGRISRLCEGKKFPLGLYLLDDCPITYAVYNNAKKFFKINGEFKGERNLLTIGTVL